jgi:hypothetical protein
LQVCLVNKDLARGVRVEIAPGRDFANASVMRLIGPAPDATIGITLGGANVDAFGRWSPKPEAVHMEPRAVTIYLAAASAAFVSMTA